MVLIDEDTPRDVIMASRVAFRTTDALDELFMAFFVGPTILVKS